MHGHEMNLGWIIIIFNKYEKFWQVCVDTLQNSIKYRHDDYNIDFD